MPTRADEYLYSVAAHRIRHYRLRLICRLWSDRAGGPLYASRSFIRAGPRLPWVEQERRDGRADDRIVSNGGPSNRLQRRDCTSALSKRQDQGLRTIRANRNSAFTAVNLSPAFTLGKEARPSAVRTSKVKT